MVTQPACCRCKAQTAASNTRPEMSESSHVNEQAGMNEGAYDLLQDPSSTGFMDASYGEKVDPKAGHLPTSREAARNYAHVKVVGSHPEIKSIREGKGPQADGHWKRFNEFLGKRSPVPMAIMRNPYLFPFTSQQPSSSNDEALAVTDVSPVNSGMGQRDNLIKIFRHAYRLLGAKAHSKRQYEFIGKRLNMDVGPTTGDGHAMEDDQDKRYEFLGKRNYDFLGKRNYDFLGKRSYDFLGKRNYDFLGKRNYDFLGKRSYDFLGKRSYDFLGKRNYDFLGKRPDDADDKRSYDFLGKRQPGSPDAEAIEDIHAETSPDDKRSNTVDSPVAVFSPLKDAHLATRRYSEWVGKRKRSSLPISDQQRLALLLRNNTLRKRLSQMLMGSHAALQRGPEFIGK